MTTDTATAVPLAVLSALGRLNPHARAYGCGKRAIYAYKTLVAGLLLESGAAALRLVQWTGTCGHCGGTGRYVDSCGEKWPHCRQCGNTGTVTLKFVETTLPDDQVWHHPWKHDQGGQELGTLAGLAIWSSTPPWGWRDAKGYEPIFRNITTGWQPRQPAERLSPVAAAADLNAVEGWLLDLSLPPGSQLRWPCDRARTEMRRYVLDLGRVGDRCWFCPSAEIHIGLGRLGPPFRWSAPVCREHADIDPTGWPTVLPESALTPALIEWRRRHQAVGFVDTNISWD